MRSFKARLAYRERADRPDLAAKALLIRGIISFELDQKENSIIVEATHPLALEKLENALLAAGITLTSDKTLFNVRKGDPSEAAAACKIFKGVLSATVWKKGLILATYLPAETDPALIARALENNYGSRIEKAYITSPFIANLSGQQGRAFIASGLLLLIGIIANRFSPSVGIFSFTAAATAGGIPIARAAWAGIRNRSINFNILVLIALAAAILSGHYLAAAEVAFLMSLGVMLEEYTQKRSFEASASLLQFLPQHALLKKEGREETVPFSELNQGDLIVVAPGRRVPVDGLVTRGQTWVDQSALTGESAPVEKTPGSAVLSGSLNLSGLIEVVAEKVGPDTSISQTAALLDKYKGEESAFSRLVDRVAGHLVPLVLILALLGYYFTAQVTVAVTILIGACPCALVMATPSATRAGIVNASLNGVLIKGGRFLELLAAINCIAIDKTGTLTTSSHRLTGIEVKNQWQRKDLLFFAATAERYSDHPLARAIKGAALAEGVEPGRATSFEIVPGGGIFALVEGRAVSISAASDDEIKRKAGDQEKPADTALAITIDEERAGTFYLSGQVKKEAGQAIKDLKDAGINKFVILSGDSEEATAKMAHDLELESYRAELLPEEKVELIETLIRDGYKVAMIGDGINDAPALAAADLGIAMGLKGTELAVDTAPIVLLGDKLDILPYTYKLARKTAAVIRQNIVFACLIILLLVIFAFMGYVGPAAGALLHKGSTVIVILNAMRLMTFKG